MSSRDAAQALDVSSTAVLQHRRRKCRCFANGQPLQTQPKGRLIVLEGIDGSGKSTQMAFLKQALGQTHNVSCFREPSDRSVLSKGSQAWDEDHLSVVQEARAALSRGDVVLVDRWRPYSGRAYQGRAFDPSDNKFQPDVVLWIDIPVRIALKRASDGDVFEMADADEWVKRREEYHKMAKSSDRWHRIDGAQTIAKVHLDCLEVVEPLLGPTPTATASANQTPVKVEYDSSDATMSFDGLVLDSPLAPKATSEDGAFAKLFELARLDPAEFELVNDTFRMSVWESGQEVKYAYRGSFRKKSPIELDDVELERLSARARTTREAGPGPHRFDEQYKTRVLVVSDMQIGKVDSRGGLEEFLTRVSDMCAQIEALPFVHSTIILDPGDLIEGFQNTSSQAHTNDLSHPAMLKIARSVLTDVVEAARASTLPDGVVTVATVPSNHSAWRQGKGYLGKPGDDYGLDVHRAVQSVFEYAEVDDVEWVFPDTEYEESLSLPVPVSPNTRVGLVHGHQARSGKFNNWWKGQALGSKPLADCHYAVSGHYHSFVFESAGWLDGRERYHIQAPPMDNGSAWWENLSGEQSRPGIVHFLVDEQGDFSDLRLIVQP
jgi:thymidylate kinase|nr:MAG TPA: DNA polymerase II small subunit [Caudoviricetes sp.]